MTLPSREYVEGLPAGTPIPILREDLLFVLDRPQVLGVEPDLTVAQAAVKLGVKPATVRGYIARGELQFYKPKGRKGNRITLAALAEYEARLRPAIDLSTHRKAS